MGAWVVSDDLFVWLGLKYSNLAPCQSISMVKRMVWESALLNVFELGSYICESKHGWWHFCGYLHSNIGVGNSYRVKSLKIFVVFDSLAIYMPLCHWLFEGLFIVTHTVFSIRRFINDISGFGIHREGILSEPNFFFLEQQTFVKMFLFVLDRYFFQPIPNLFFLYNSVINLTRCELCVWK